jgi:hypothetical protein
LAILLSILGCGACKHKDAGSIKVQKLPDDVVFMGDQAIGGVHFQWKAMAEPKGSRERLGWLGQSGAATMYTTPVGSASGRTVPRLHRVYWEKKAHTYFGYDLAAERSDSEGNCRVGVAPLSVSLAQMAGAGIDAKSFTSIQLQTYSETQVVRSGDTISLVLLTSPDRSIKVVDYVQVSCKDAPLYAAAETAAKEGAPPRDISVRDIEMGVVDPQITINGNHLDAVVLHGHNAGPVVWFHIPGKGRFVLSLARYRGFAQEGTVTRGAISFQHGGDRYEIHSSQPLFQSPQTWNLYVRTDESHRTGGEAAFGSADRPENVR